MADTNWRGLEQWERVKWARQRRFETAISAADFLGMKDGTYRAYERSPESKHTQLDYKRARDFGQAFGVRWEWLLDGEDQPWLTDDSESVGAKTPNNIRIWREHRGLTREALAQKVGTTATIVGQLEAGELELSDKWLRRLAEPLGVAAGHLLEHTPETLKSDLFEAALEVPPERREQVLQILRTFKSDKSR